MKTAKQSLIWSYLTYLFFVLWSGGTAIKMTQLSLSEFMVQFWRGYGVVFIIIHALYVVGFLKLQDGVNEMHQHPASLNKEQAKERQRKAKVWLGWVGAAFWISVVGLLGIGMSLIFFSWTAGFAIIVPPTFILLHLLLVASGLNIIIQNYQHFLRKVLAETVEDVIAESKRPPVLYLRSFLDDKVTSSTAYMTEEEQTNKAFAPFGPMIAIGRPGEVLPEVGAARAYFTDDQWQAAVYHYMDISCLVVLRGGFSQGLLWEIRNSIQRLDPTKLILLIPFKKDAYDQFRVNVQSLFPKPLPDHPGHEFHRIIPGLEYEGQRREEKEILSSLFGLIYFDEDWTAHFEKVSADNLPLSYKLLVSKMADKNMMTSYTYLMLHYALRPIYARLGLAWDDLGILWENPDQSSQK